MVRYWVYRLGVVLKTKVGIALVGALVLGGGGTAMAMTNAPAGFLSHLVGSTSTSAGTHGEDQAHSTKTAGKGDQDNDDNAACANRTPGAKMTEAPDADDAGTSGTHADTEGTPGTHTDAEGTAGTHTDTEGTPSATHTGGDDSHEGSEVDCEGHSNTPTGSRTPEPTEHPEWTSTPHASPSSGHGGD
jgi:hypothetical protein